LSAGNDVYAVSDAPAGAIVIEVHI
jgi:hypothetical protein